MTSLTCFYLNVACAPRDDTPETDWGKRSIKISKMIRELSPDLIVLVEMRQEPMKFLITLADIYNIDMREYNQNKTPFALAILTKRTKIYRRYLETHNYFNAPETDKIFMALGCEIDGKRLEICTTHFPIADPGKDICIDWMLKDYQPREGFRPIIFGDFNTFMNGKGAEQMERLSSRFSDIAYPFFGEDDKELNTSFYGFHHDHFRIPPEKFYENDGVGASKVDHIFIVKDEKKIMLSGKVICPFMDRYSFDNSRFPPIDPPADSGEKPMYPSDHMAFHLTVQL
jgi:endonuclease/exonuclease/phosphatase family metal-dependent hydrolase